MAASLYLQKDLTNNFHVALDRQIENALKHNVNEVSYRSPIESIASRIGLSDRSDVSPTISAIPEALFGEIFDKDLHGFAQVTQSGSFYSAKGALLCHALSPHKESLGLLLELGRAARFSRIFNIPRHIMLAGPLWGGMNWVVKDLNGQHNLHACLDYRKRLYKVLGFTCDVCDLDSMGDGGAITSATELDALSHAYEKLCQVVWGREISRDKIPKDIADNLAENISIKVSLDKEGNTADLLQLLPVRRSLDFHVTAITTVLRRLRRTDYETFKYFFLQRHFQLYYSGYIKLAVSREMDFDKPFAQLNDIEKKDNYKLHSVYFDDYYYHRDPNHGAATVHPYYFPSGTLYEAAENPREAEKYAIMLDSGVEHIKEKLVGIANDRIIVSIMADLLFIAAELLHKNSRAIEQIATRLKSISPQFGASWKKHAKSVHAIGRLCRTWGDLTFTRFADKVEIPFFVYPGLVYYAESDPGKRQDVAKIYSDVIAVVLDELHRALKVKPSWESI